MAQVQREKRLHCAAHVASVSAITIRTSGTLEPIITDPEQGFNCSHILSPHQLHIMRSFQKQAEEAIWGIVDHRRSPAMQGPL